MSPRCSPTRLLGLSFVAIAAVPAAAQSLLPIQGQVVAKTGDAPIGVGAGETIAASTSGVDTAVMSRNGKLLFRSMLQGGASTNLDNRGLLLGHTSGDLTMIVRTDTTVLDPVGHPNSKPVSVSASSGVANSSNTLDFYRISPNGNFILFNAQMYDGGNPGLDGLVHTTGVGPVNDKFLFWGAPGAPQVLAKQNTTTMPGGAVLSNIAGSILGWQQTALNSAGTAIFKAGLAGGDVVGTTNDIAWIKGTPGNLAYFLREGDLVLGGQNAIAETWTATNNSFNCVLNESGDVLSENLLSTTIGSPPATSTSDSIIFITPAATGIHTKVAREGDLAPDFTGASIPGTFYGTLTLGQGFGSDATMAFYSAMTGAVTTADDGALFFGLVGGAYMLAREGEVAPGTGGETIAVINSTTSYSETAGVVFGCTLVAPGVNGVTAQDDSALYVAKIGSPPTLIVREGDACPGLPGYVFRSSTGSSNFGSSSNHRTNARGQITFNFSCYDVVNASQVSAMYSWDALLGLQLQLVSSTGVGDLMGSGMVTGISPPLQLPGGDGSTLGLTENGDFTVRCSTLPTGSFVARGHIGSLQGTPSAVPVAGGVPHVMNLDCTPAHAFQFYIVLATGAGTEPGFPNPLNFALNVPLNPGGSPDWIQLSFDLANSLVWGNTLSFTDALGKATATFTMPAGYPMFQGTTLHHAAALFDFTLLGTYVTEAEPCYLY